MNPDSKLEIYRKYVEGLLSEQLEERNSITADAAAYSVTAGGKRLRPIFLLCFFKAFENRIPEEDRETARNLADALAVSIEFIHTYSLVHDDLPDMDNDLLRRGKPTTHAKYGAGEGILTGDALLNEAFNVGLEGICRAGRENKKLALDGARALAVIGKCAGKDGMILGQEIDLKNEGRNVTLDQILKMYELKTSRLLEAAFMAGAILGGADDREVRFCEKAALNLGIAFQIRDDILDVTGDELTLGKPVNSDERNGKCTYVSLRGLENAAKDVEEYTDLALEAVRTLDVDTGFIEQLMLSLIERES